METSSIGSVGFGRESEVTFLKKALVVAATAGFVRGFLVGDMRQLQEMGYEVHCAAGISKNMSFDPDEWFSRLGFPFHRIDFSSRSPLSRGNWAAAKQFKRLMKAYSFDAIHCHTPIAGAIVRVVASPRHRKGCRILYTTHGLAFVKRSSVMQKIVYGGTEWFCAKLCDGVITINRDDYRAMKRLSRRPVFYINGVGVDTEKYHRVSVDRAEYRREIGVGEGDVMVVAVGELSERKNHQVIIKARAKLNDPRYIFVVCGKVMVGAGTYDQLRVLAKSLKVRVAFLGFRKDIPEILHCADIAVVPSLREGLGLAGIEALASGVPVVGSAVQGIKDYVVEGETGFLCASPTDPGQFAEGIGKLSDPALRSAMREACVAKAEAFRTEISRGQMRDIYQDVFGRSESERR
jgi:glycosyltransferase involved in cell wall biosynthesis